MKEVIIFCSGASHIKEEIKKNKKADYLDLDIEKFPDNEINVKIPKNLKNKKVFLIQSFYENPDEKIIETLFAAHNAKQLGAKKINLIALYFPYLRKDKSFEKGECVAVEAVSKMFKIFNRISIFTPHLHRIKKLNKIMKNSKSIDLNEEIAKYLRDVQLNDPIFISPDIESERIVKGVSGLLGKNFVVLRKKRYDPRKVKVEINKKIRIENRDVVIIDDIISTGNTMLEAIKEIKNYNPRKIYCIGVHGIFVENALKRIEDEAIVISTNTIPSRASIINITERVVEELI